MNKKIKKDEVQAVQDFFTRTLEYTQELQKKVLTYELIFGKLPVDDESSERIRKELQMYTDAEPLLKGIEKIALNKKDKS